MNEMMVHRSIQMMILGVIIYALFIILSSAEQTLDVIASFPPVEFFLMLCAAFTNYLIRFIKWEYFLRKIKVRIPLLASFLCFIAGFSMTLTPAKSGELIKPWLLTRLGYESIKTAPIVIVERITDLFGMIVLLLVSAALLGIGFIPAAVLFIILLFLLIPIQHEGFINWIKNLLMRTDTFAPYQVGFDTVIQSTRVLSGPFPFIVSVILSAASWFFECICLALALEGFGYSFTIVSSVFIFASSTIAGLIVMIPGGLGATEGLMAILITNEGVPLEISISATLLTRVATLWFAVGIGMVALFLFNLKYSVKLSSP